MRFLAETRLFKALKHAAKRFGAQPGDRSGIELPPPRNETLERLELLEKRMVAAEKLNEYLLTAIQMVAEQMNGPLARLTKFCEEHQINTDEFKKARASLDAIKKHIEDSTQSGGEDNADWWKK